MNAMTATEYARKLIAQEMRGPSDLSGSMTRLEARYGLPYWTLDYLRRGKAKVCDAAVFSRLRGAYLDHCERQLCRLQMEIEIERAKGNDLDSDLLTETEALLAKIRARRQR